MRGRGCLRRTTGLPIAEYQASFRAPEEEPLPY